MRMIKKILVAGVLGGVVSTAAMAQVKVINTEPVKCAYYDGYMKCATGPNSYKTYYPYKKYKVCTPQGVCHWVFCYQGFGCKAYNANRVY